MEGEGKMGSTVLDLGGEGIRGLLMEIEERYSDVFAEIGPGALRHFRQLIDEVEEFLDFLEDPKAMRWTKLIYYAKTRDNVAEFCWFYMRWLGYPLAERLKAEIYQLLEEALRWWRGQTAYGEVER